MTAFRKGKARCTLRILAFTFLLLGFITFFFSPAEVSARSVGNDAMPQEGDTDGGTDEEETDATGEDEDEPGFIQGILTHVVSITSDSLYDVWTGVLEESSEDYVDQMEPKVSKLADLMAAIYGGYTSQGLEGLVFESMNGTQTLVDKNLLSTVQDVWRKVFNVALIFFPLVILVNVGSTLTSGVSAPVARAEMLEGLVKALVSLGFCAGSFIIGSYAIKLGWGISAELRPSFINTLFSSMMLFVPLGTYGIFGVFIVFLIVTLVLMIFIALVLSHYAVLVITIGLLVISPLIIVLGNFKPFSWLYWTWTKGFTTTLLVPSANAILMLLWSSTGNVVANIMNPLVSQCISMGFLCLLITLNFTIGKIIYQPFMEATKKAFKATRDLARIAVGIAGAAVGAAGVSGALGTAGAASGSGGGGVLPGGGAGATQGTLAAGGGNAFAGGTEGASSFSQSGGSLQNNNPYLGMSKSQQRVAGSHLNNARETLRASRSFTSNALRNSPALNGAAHLFFQGQGQKIAGQETALQAAIDNEPTRRDAVGASKLPLTDQSNQNNPLFFPSPYASTAKSAILKTGEEPEYMEHSYKGFSREDFRERAYNFAGNVYDEQRRDNPSFDDNLKNAGVTEGQYMAALAYQSNPSAFTTRRPDDPRAFTNRDAQDIFNKFEGTDLAKMADRAKSYYSPSANPEERPLLFYDQLKGNSTSGSGKA